MLSPKRGWLWIGNHEFDFKLRGRAVLTMWKQHISFIQLFNNLYHYLPGLFSSDWWLRWMIGFSATGRREKLWIRWGVCSDAAWKDFKQELEAIKCAPCRCIRNVSRNKWSIREIRRDSCGFLHGDSFLTGQPPKVTQQWRGGGLHHYPIAWSVEVRANNTDI